MHTEKYSNINCAETEKVQKGAESQLWGTGSVIRRNGSQVTGAGSELRRDPPQFNPWWILDHQSCSFICLLPHLIRRAQRESLSSACRSDWSSRQACRYELLRGPSCQQDLRHYKLTYLHIWLVTFGSQGLDYTSTIHAFIHTYTKNRKSSAIIKRTLVAPRQLKPCEMSHAWKWHESVGHMILPISDV